MKAKTNSAEVFEKLKGLKAKGPDSSLECSLFDYGFVYVPIKPSSQKEDKKGLIIFSQAKEVELLPENPSLEDYTYDFVWITQSQVKKDITNQPEDFFRYIDIPKQSYVIKIVSELDIVSAIWDLESYNAFYSSECDFGYEAIDVLYQLEGIRR